MANKITWKEAARLTARCIRDIEKNVPGRILSTVLDATIKAVSPYLTIWFSAQLINELAGLRRADVLWSWVAWILGTSAVVQLVSAVLTRWVSAMNSIHNPRKENLYLQKLLDMDFADADSQHTHDLRAQIIQNENWNGWGMNIATQSVEKLTKAVMGILGAVALTFSLFTSVVPADGGELNALNNPMFAVGLLAVMVIILLLSNKGTTTFNRKWAESAEDATFGNRVFSFFCGLSQRGILHLDIRTYGQYSVAEHRMDKENVFGPGSRFDRLLSGKYCVWAAVAGGGAAVFTGFVYVFTCLKALGGAFGIGSVTQYVGAVTSLSSNVSALLYALGEIKNNAVFLKSTYEFLDIPNSMYQGSLTTEKRSDRQYEVEFRDVSFKYPGSDLWALRHVNMKFKVGRRLAIVGENGSGKTTFIKLLCRLYDPQEGQILLNGIDIRKYRYDDYMNIFSVVFQDFQLICQPLGANVAGSMDYDRDRVHKALIDAGFGERLATMEKGLDTMLYKDLSEDGVDISGGEAQKIAIARALYKNAPFIILDEPTAALDPIAEAEIYSKFNDIAGDKTAIYISHRLSSCKFCDEIAVFHEGAVIQHGTHSELLADESGKYHQLWTAQAQYYTEQSP